MDSSNQSELPGYSSRRSVYLVFAALIVVFTLILRQFSEVFLIPKLNQLWEIAGLTGSSAQWWPKGAALLIHDAPLLIVLIGLAAFALERWFAGWNRFRDIAVLGAAIAFQTVILVGITAIACASLLAAPLAAAKAAKPKAGAAPAVQAP